MHQVSSLIGRFKGEFVVMGDYNLSPQELVGTGWDLPSKSYTTVPNNSAITYRGGSGSLIDYALVSRGIAQGIKTYVDLGTGIKMHYGVGHTIRADIAKLRTLQAKRPKKIVIKDEIGPKMEQLDWATSTRIAQECKLKPRAVRKTSVEHASNLGDPGVARSLGWEYSRLMSTIEVQYLSQLSHNKEGMRPYMGGGLPLKLAMLPIIGKLPAAHMYRDNGLSAMNEVLSAIDLIIALENKGKNTCLLYTSPSPRDRG